MAKSIKKVGDWGNATRMCNEIGADINKVTGVVLKRIGLETEKLVIKYVKRQPGTWPALSETYKQRKIREGHSPMMLIRTSDYFQRITSHYNDSQKQVFIGVKKGVLNKEGDDLVLIGAVLEYGRKGETKKARPHYRPVHKHMNRKIKQDDLLNKSVLKYVNQKYGIR